MPRFVAVHLTEERASRRTAQHGFNLAGQRLCFLESPLRRKSRVHHCKAVFAVVVQQRSRPQPFEQRIAVRSAQHVAESVLGPGLARSGGGREQVQSRGYRGRSPPVPRDRVRSAALPVNADLG